MFNALMPGEHNYQMGRKMPGQGRVTSEPLGPVGAPAMMTEAELLSMQGPGATPRQPAPMQAKPKKNRPILNALGSYFQFAAPEEYQAGRMARMNKDYGNALASGDMEKAAQYRLQMGDFEGAQQIQQYTAGQQEAARKQEAQGVYQLFSQMDPMQINEMVMSNPAVFEQYTGMSSDEYNQIAQTLTQAGMRPEQIHQYVLQKAQAELGMAPAGPTEGKVINDRLVNPYTGEEIGNYSDPATRYRVLTPEEVQEYGLPAGSGYQVNEATGQIEALGRSGALVSVNTGNVGAGERPLIGDPPKDYQAVWDKENQTYRFEPIPGSDAAREREGAAIKANTSMQLADQQMELMNSTIDKAISQADFWSAGLMAQATSGIGATPARNLRATLETVMANIGFEKLQEMRETSPTGGALGNVTERELAFLQSVRGSLDQIQDPAQLREVLAQVKQSLQIIHAIRKMNMQGNITNSGDRIPTGNIEQATDLPPGFEVVQ